MSVKEKLKIWSERLKLQWRGCGKLMYVPLAVNYILLPVTAYIMARNSMYHDYGNAFVEQMFYFVPVMSVWWIMLIMQEYVEGDGHEVLWVYNKNKVFDVLAYTVLYLISLLPHLDIGVFYLDAYIGNFTIIFAQCIFYSGVMFVLSMATRSIVPGFVFALAYTLYSGARMNEILEAVHLYSLKSEGGYVFAAVVCFVLGTTFSFRGRMKVG